METGQQVIGVPPLPWQGAEGRRSSQDKFKCIQAYLRNSFHHTGEFSSSGFVSPSGSAGTHCLPLLNAPLVDSIHLIQRSFSY